MSFDISDFFTRLQSAKDSGGLTQWSERIQFAGSPSKRADVYLMLAALIADGKPLDSAIRGLYTRYREKKRFLAFTMGKWLGVLDEGKEFSVAIKGYASDTEVILLAAAEKAGDMGSGFSQAADVALQSQAIRTVLFNELRGPVINLSALLLLLIGFSVFTAPQLSAYVPASAMDESQRNLFALASFVEAYWYFGLGFFGALFWIVGWSLPNYTGQFRAIFDKIPPWSIYKIYSSSVFMVSLAALIKAGVPIESAIRFIQRQATPWMRGHLAVMAGRLRSGTDQGKSMDTGMLSDRLSDMISIYASTASFDTAISTMGKQAAADGIKVISAQAGLVKTLSLIATGFLVAWILTAVMGIGDAAQRASESQQNTVNVH